MFVLRKALAEAKRDACIALVKEADGAREKNSDKMRRVSNHYAALQKRMLETRAAGYGSSGADGLSEIALEQMLLQRELEAVDRYLLEAGRGALVQANMQKSVLEAQLQVLRQWPSRWPRESNAAVAAPRPRESNNAMVAAPRPRESNAAVAAPPVTIAVRKTDGRTSSTRFHQKSAAKRAAPSAAFNRPLGCDTRAGVLSFVDARTKVGMLRCSRNMHRLLKENSPAWDPLVLNRSMAKKLLPAAWARTVGLTLMTPSSRASTSEATAVARARRYRAPVAWLRVRQMTLELLDPEKYARPTPKRK
ncbi:unnamed protein product, partial [Durusdinium trenchii]